MLIVSGRRTICRSRTQLLVKVTKPWSLSKNTLVLNPVVFTPTFMINPVKVENDDACKLMKLGQMKDLHQQMVKLGQKVKLLGQKVKLRQKVKLGNQAATSLWLRVKMEIHHQGNSHTQTNSKSDNA